MTIAKTSYLPLQYFTMVHRFSLGLLSSQLKGKAKEIIHSQGDNLAQLVKRQCEAEVDFVSPSFPSLRKQHDTHLSSSILRPILLSKIDNFWWEESDWGEEEALFCATL